MAQPTEYDLDPSGRPGVLLGGAENVAAALLRELRCPLGYLPHRPGYGSTLHQFLGEPMDVATALSVRGEIARVCLRAERVEKVLAIALLPQDALDSLGFQVEVLTAYGPLSLSGSVNRL